MGDDAVLERTDEPPARGRVARVEAAGVGTSEAESMRLAWGGIRDRERLA